MNLFETYINHRSMVTSTERLDLSNKEAYAQYFTPIEIAKYMASLFDSTTKKNITVLDPGSGIGNLTFAFLIMVLKWKKRPVSIHIDLYEKDKNLIPELIYTLQECVSMCQSKNINVVYTIYDTDFISSVSSEREDIKKYDYIIMNPPYKKLESGGEHDNLLKGLDIKVPNYYAAFMSLGKYLLDEKGQMVSITPRSFFNGLYFEKFRINLLETLTLDTIHLFESRKELFHDDVLQETVIMKFVKSSRKKSNVNLISSEGNDFSGINISKKKYSEVIFPTDKQKVIRILADIDEELKAKMDSLEHSLEELGISVSTGPIVDFRNRESLSIERFDGTHRMIYAHNIRNMVVDLNVESSKPKYIIETPNCKNALRNSGIYILINRFSSKEEPNRIRAAILDGREFDSEKFGFDNKINYFHINKNGLDNIYLATGLWVYLNSDFVDFYFRTFSGNTQVNATDLKQILKYPSVEQLVIIGRMYESGIFNDYSFDNLLDVYVFNNI